MADSDGGAGKRQKTMAAADPSSTEATDEERAAQMTPTEILALMKQIQKSQEEKKQLESNLAKAQRKLQQSTVKTSHKSEKIAKTKKVTSVSALVPITTKAEKLSDLSRAEKEVVLKKISFPSGEDRTKNEASARSLQIVLWLLHCNYCLQNHQFLGARAAAGVSEDDFLGDLTLDSSRQQIEEMLERVPWRISNPGMIIADVMGLGKTVEAIAGALLRNALADIKRQPKKPTLICSPNEAVLFQWHQTLIKAGVDTRKIFRFRTKKPVSLTGDIFVLCTMYDLQTEVRYCFDGINKASYKSPLFVSAPGKLLEILRNQYRSEKGRMKNKYNNRGKTNVNEVIRRYLGKYDGNCTLTFRTVILDEAHFLRNLKTYWGMAAALIGLHSERMIPMSGTPFNNTLQDMATLMTFIDPAHSAAKFKWWKDNTKNGQARIVVKSIEGWSREFLIRRGKDVIAGQLPAKVVSTKHIAPSGEELAVYSIYERKVLSVQKQMHKLQSEAPSPGGRKQMNECFRKFMALAANAMLALDHPILPGGGRSLSIFFSPSRRNLKSALTKQEKRNICVCCKRNTHFKLHRSHENEPYMEMLTENDDIEDLLEPEDDPEARKRTTTLGKRQREKTKKALALDQGKSGEDATEDFEINSNEEEYVPEKNGEGELPDDDVLSEGEYDDEVEEESADDASMEDESNDEADDDFDDEETTEQGRGEIVSIPPGLCKSAKLGIRHYACQSCLESLKSCPRCDALISCLHKANQPDSTTQKKNCTERRYSKLVFGGFQASAKLSAVLSSFSKIPSNEKTIIVSFYKGSLDLLEAMLSETFPDLEVARFDGDITTDEREEVLHQFKTSPACRVLLMTVQTGGVGLNLVAANHMLFIDRFWNPMVLEQCEDRCHRIGQEKKVTVVYHDASNTIDEVMAEINRCKASNAGIILADAPALIANPCFKETTGLFGNGLRRMQQIRKIAEESKSNGSVAPHAPQKGPSAILSVQVNKIGGSNLVVSRTLVPKEVESHRRVASDVQYPEHSNGSLPAPPLNKAQLRFLLKQFQKQVPNAISPSQHVQKPQVVGNRRAPLNKDQLQLLLKRFKKQAPDAIFPTQNVQKPQSVCDKKGDSARSRIIVDTGGFGIIKEECHLQTTGRHIVPLPAHAEKNGVGKSQREIIDLCNSDEETM